MNTLTRTTTRLIVSTIGALALGTGSVRAAHTHDDGCRRDGSCRHVPVLERERREAVVLLDRARHVVSGLREEQVDLEREIGKLRRRLARLERKRDEVGHELHGLEDAGRRLRVQLAALERRLAVLERDIAACDSGRPYGGARFDVRHAGSRHARARALRHERRRIREAIEDVAEGLRRVERGAVRARKEYEAIDCDVAERRRVIGRSGHRLARIDRDIVAGVREIHALEARLAEIEREITLCRSWRPARDVHVGSRPGERRPWTDRRWRRGSGHDAVDAFLRFVFVLGRS